MNNLDALLADHDSVLFDALDCDCCVFHNGEKVCIYDFDMCERGMREWLLSEHVDANDAFTPENDVRTDDMDANDANDALDNREKLEADVNTALYGLAMSDDGYMPQDMVIGWLNRQAAITEREREQHWLEIVGASANCNLELTNQIAELTEQVAAKNRCIENVMETLHDTQNKLKVAQDVNERQDLEYISLSREIGTLRAERDHYRELCGKLLDAADEMRRVRDQFDAFTEVDR